MSIELCGCVLGCATVDGLEQATATKPNKKLITKIRFTRIPSLFDTYKTFPQSDWFQICILL